MDESPRPMMIMKGPGYVADGLRASHSDRPSEHMESAEEATSRRRPPGD